MKYLPLWCLRRHSLNAGKWCMGFHRTSSLCFCHPPFLATQFPHTSGMNLTHTHRQALQVNTTGLSFRDKDESFSFALFVANTSKNMLAIIHNVSHWVPLGVKKKRVFSVGLPDVYWSDNVLRFVREDEILLSYFRFSFYVFTHFQICPSATMKGINVLSHLLLLQKNTWDFFWMVKKNASKKNVTFIFFPNSFHQSPVCHRKQMLY